MGWWWKTNFHFQFHDLRHGQKGVWNIGGWSLQGKFRGWSPPWGKLRLGIVYFVFIFLSIVCAGVVGGGICFL